MVVVRGSSTCETGSGGIRNHSSSSTNSTTTNSTTTRKNSSGSSRRVDGGSNFAQISGSISICMFGSNSQFNSLG